MLKCGGEGLVSRKKDTPYYHGRSESLLKFKVILPSLDSPLLFAQKKTVLDPTLGFLLHSLFLFTNGFFQAAKDEEGLVIYVDQEGISLQL